MRLRGHHYATGELVDVVCEAGQIATITPPLGTADREAGWVAPAFFDLQINGCDGHSFNSEDLTLESVRHVADVCRRHGIGGFCPTLVTNSFVALAHGMATVRRARETDTELFRAI